MDHTSGAWGRYVISDGQVIRGGWLTVNGNGETYAIDGIPSGPAAHVKAILYAPGCSVQTADIAIREAQVYRYVFRCESVPRTELRGSVTRLDRLYGKQVTVEAKYVAPWASEFLGYKDGTATEIPLGYSTTLDQRNGFVLPVPELSIDKTIRRWDTSPEIRIWVREKTSGRIIAQLRPTPQDSTAQGSTRFGGIAAASLPSAPLEVMMPCAANPPGTHDQFGFGIRPASDDACD